MATLKTDNGIRAWIESTPGEGTVVRISTKGVGGAVVVCTAYWPLKDWEVLDAFVRSHASAKEMK